jgi:hypothetical protein
MRTKTLLLAAAALAAGLFNSQAQTPVYSQNIVGYVNQPLLTGANLINVPLSNGGTNADQIGLTNSFNSSGGETIYVQNPTRSGFYGYTYEGIGAGQGNNTLNSDWVDAFATFSGSTVTHSSSIPGSQTDTVNQVVWVPSPGLQVGQGFQLVNPNPNETNTFAGTVTTSNSVAIPTGATFFGSYVPLSGNVTNAAGINLTANFNGAGGETLYVQNPTRTGFWGYTYEGFGAGSGNNTIPSDWVDAFATFSGSTVTHSSSIPGSQTDTVNQVIWVPSPNLNVGQGFELINPNSSENWTQSITNN